MNSLDQAKKEFETSLLRVTSLVELDQLNTAFLGRLGHVNTLLKSIAKLAPEERKSFGASVNELKRMVDDKLKSKRQALLTKEDKTFVDTTMPGTAYPKGSLHLITIAIEEITRIFEKIGFIRMSYPEVEWEYFAFEALNMPKTHPARDDFETTFIEAPEHPENGKMVLTPHTSSGQVREMWRLGKPPVRMINISKCYRPNWDATHTPMFFQFEGLCVDRDINITHLRGTLDYFVKSYFGPDREVRLRPHHFQFTEPSFEVDITCGQCNGTGKVKDAKCKVCKSGWLELGGTGMVHPNVLKAGKMDEGGYSGWAFGFGIERVIMMKYGIDDIRNYYTGDIRFLEQF